ncbi:MAG: rod shape-determining protein MreD [Acidobacteriota bacterium]
MLDFLRPFSILVLIVLMVILQVFLTRYFPWVSILDLPLISVVYLTVAKESLVWTVFSGSAVGFLQDSLSLSIMGLNGFTKISIGCLAYLANTVFAIDRVITRFLLLFVCSVLSALLFLILRILFMNREEIIAGQQILLSGTINACVGLPLFYLFDKIVQAPSN